MNFRVIGNREPKKVHLLMVHGFPLNGTMWQQQHSLSDSATLLIPDLPGFGNSRPLQEPVSMAGMADCLLPLLDEVGSEQVVLCGLSMGGYIGWEFAARHPERLQGLICCNTRAAADDETTARARKIAASEVMKTGSEPVADAMSKKLLAESTQSNSPATVESLHRMIRDTPPETIAAFQLAMAQRRDQRERLGDIGIPALVVAGSDDIVTPASEMEQMAAAMPDSTFVEIPQSGHLTPMEQPEQFNHAVSEWLRTSF